MQVKQLGEVTAIPRSELFQKAWQIGILTAVPFILVAGPLVGYFAGDWIDRRYHSDPYAKAAFIVLGFVASVRQIVQITRRVMK